MNSVKKMSIAILAMGLLVGCNNKEPKVESNAEQMKPVNSNEEVVKTTDIEQQFPFTDFSLEVEYEKDISYEVEYENERDRVEAEIDDEVNNVHVKGDEAFTQLTKHLEMLTFDEQSTDEEVLKQVMDAFELADNYKKVEIEVTFNDGTKKEYNFRK